MVLSTIGKERPLHQEKKDNHGEKQSKSIFVENGDVMKSLCRTQEHEDNVSNESESMG